MLWRRTHPFYHILVFRLIFRRWLPLKISCNLCYNIWSSFIRTTDTNAIITVAQNVTNNFPRHPLRGNHMRMINRASSIVISCSPRVIMYRHEFLPGVSNLPSDSFRTLLPRSQFARNIVRLSYETTNGDDTRYETLMRREIAAALPIRDKSKQRDESI